MLPSATMQRVRTLKAAPGRSKIIPTHRLIAKIGHAPAEPDRFTRRLMPTRLARVLHAPRGHVPPAASREATGEVLLAEPALVD